MPQAVLSRTAALLADEFEGVFSVQTAERYVFESYTAHYRTATVHTHLTSLAQRFAADRLTALAQSQGAAPKDVPEVLFLCVHDAGRSQMAAALLTHRARGRVHVRSAGSAPTATINPTVIEAMAEIGLDLGQEFPKPLTDDVVARRLRGHHGLRRRLPGLPRHALPRLGVDRPRRRRPRHRSADP